MSGRPLLVLAAVLGAAPLAAQIMLRPDPLNAAWLSVPDATKTLMRSGFDYNDANYDSGNLIRVEPAGAAFTDPGSEWVLFDAAGPGVVTSIWFTGKSKAGAAYLGGRLNFYFDGERRPGISGALPDLFTGGEVFPKPLAEPSSGGWVSYAPVYFTRSLKITVTEHADSYGHRTNGRGETIPHLYHQFTYQRLPAAAAKPAGRDRVPVWSRDKRGRVEVRNGDPLVYEAKGKGILNGLRLRWAGGQPDRASIRIVADGETTVDLTVPEFWGFERRRRPEARFQSLLLGVDGDGAYYAWFPMPHRRSLRIEVRGGGPVRAELLHADGWFEREHYQFRAARVSDATEPGRDIVILKAAGPGHLAGMILELADKTMEGDDRFYVDGEPFPPSWHGTGTEDYFRCGWYFHGGPITRPLYGMLDQAKPKIAYRFHLADRVNFTRSAVIGFEHGHKNDYVGPYRGVVFWYAAFPATREVK